MSLAHSPLHDRHLAHGAKLAEFGGWEMPLEYAGGGVVAEHTAVREAVGLFDVSHLGKVVVAGPGAAEFLNACFTADLRKIGPGEAQYTMCCQDDGGVVDDLITYLRSSDEVFLMPNAANSDDVVARLVAAAPGDVSVRDQHHDHAVLAVQGPASGEVLAAIGLPVDHDYMSFVPAEVEQVRLTVCRTGYTGEHGYELVVPASGVAVVWDAVLSAGDRYGIKPCGLGSRDTLRTEMGYPLHGQDLSRQITPVMARAAWAVGWDKPRFWGREALTAQRAEKSGPLSRGLLAQGRGIPRPGMTVTKDGDEVGTVTSGTFSPTLRKGVALALLDRSVRFDDEVSVDVRGHAAPFQVVKPPFVHASTR